MTKKLVDPTTESINVALQEIWDKQMGANRIKASLFNFVVYTQTERRIDYFNHVIREVIKKFPCRVIFIHANTKKSKKDYLDTSVSVEHAGDASGKIVCDRITIEVGGKAISQVPFLLLPLLIPDLPVHLLWGQDPTIENTIFPHLEKFAARVIFDSESTDNLIPFSTRILQVMRECPCELVDMNWARMSGWRNVMVQTFDTEEKLLELKRAKSITIYYNEKKSPWFEHREIQAVYFHNWLSTCLGWTLQKTQKEKNKISLEYQFLKTTIPIELIPCVHEESPSGSIVNVTIETQTQTHYEMKRLNKDNPIVRVEVSTEEKCFLPFTIPLSTVNRGLSFIKELLYTSPSQHYIQMLKSLQKK